MHDERVDRTTKRTGNIRDMTRDQLAGTPHSTKRSLAVKGKAALMIELKVRGIADDAVSAAPKPTKSTSPHSSTLSSS